MTDRTIEVDVAVNSNVKRREVVSLGYTGDIPQTTESGIGSVPETLRHGGTVTVVEQGNGLVHKTVITLAALQQAITDALAYGSTKIYDFPEGRILILGVVGSLAFSVTGDRDTTINNNASLTWALGTAAASNITLANGMVDLIPKTTKVLDGVADAATSASTAALAASAQLDGTSAAKDAFLNFGFETNTDIDANGTLSVTGSLTIVWINLGDY